MRLLPKLLVLLLLQLGYSCKKCENCSSSFFSEQENKLLYKNVTKIHFASDIDTLTAIIESTITDPESEKCGSFPVKPSCLALGQTSIHLQNSNENYMNRLYRIDTRKDKNGWKCTHFEIGNTFFLTMDKNYSLSANYGNNDQITNIAKLIYNGTTYANAQEITKTPLGNQKELIRAIYHPSIGVIELEYTNPEVTYKRIP